MRFSEVRQALHLWNRGHWRDYIFSQAMQLTAALLLVFFIAVGLGVHRVLNRFLRTDLPAEQVRVTPEGSRAGFFRMESGGAELTDSLRGEIESLQWVSEVDPQIYSHVPAYLRGRLGGEPYYTDITLEGVTESFLSDSVAQGLDWSYTLEDSARAYLPLVLSENLILLYNASFADANDLVGLTPDGVVGTEVRLTLGRSSIAELDRPSITLNARIVATSRNLSLFALAAPLEFIDQINTFYRPERSRTYSSLLVTAERAEDVPEIVRRVEDMGLRAETRRGIAQKAELLVQTVTAALLALAFIVLAAAISSSIHTLVADLRNRRFALGVLVALGTDHRRMAWLFAFQIFFMSLITTVIGAGLGYGIAAAASSALLRIIPALSTAVENLAVFPVGWLALGLSAVLLISTGIAYIFFEKMLRQPVRDLLRQ